MIPLIEQIAGEFVRVIDPAPAVAKQAQRLLDASETRCPLGERGNVQFYTSGNVDAFKVLLPKLLGESGEIQPVTWVSDTEIGIKNGRA